MLPDSGVGARTAKKSSAIIIGFVIDRQVRFPYQERDIEMLALFISLLYGVRSLQRDSGLRSIVDRPQAQVRAQSRRG